MKEQPPKIISMVDIQCRGAYTDTSQFTGSPIPVTVDVNELGERRVSCPYMKGVSGPKPNLETRLYCDAKKYAEGDKNFTETVKNIYDETPDGKTDSENWAETLKEIKTRGFVYCYQKYPF